MADSRVPSSLSDSSAVAYMPEADQLASVVERWLRDDGPIDAAVAELERGVERVLRGDPVSGIRRVYALAARMSES